MYKLYLASDKYQVVLSLTVYMMIIIILRKLILIITLILNLSRLNPKDTLTHCLKAFQGAQTNAPANAPCLAGQRWVVVAIFIGVLGLGRVVSIK